MGKLLETIKIVNGEIRHLAFHAARLNATRATLFNIQTPIDLREFIKNVPKIGIYRCRVIYAKQVEQVEYSLYQPKIFKCFKVIEDNSITYNFKFLNRQKLDDLFKIKGTADDILLIKNGWVTDTTIANVAFWDGVQWLTPKVPLLKGTTRARLLMDKKIFVENIKLADLRHFSKMAMLNALLEFYPIADFVLS
ncbi:MAG: hypothetical protein BWK79_02675 [Beggiatoa sp. IS2]|nr:MAG: hypothetical protein BWK79_02675 [Beggiatoa sp. IS2]